MFYGHLGFLYKNYASLEQTDNNIRSLITLNELFCVLFYWMGSGLGQCDHINRMITLSVITLTGLHCTTNAIRILFCCFSLQLQSMISNFDGTQSIQLTSHYLENKS
jgi:hypothetical protein